MSTRRALFALAVAGLLALGGCGDDSPGGGNNNTTGNNNNTNSACPRQLVAVGSTTVMLQLSDSTQLTVRYEDCDGNPMAGELVSFEIVGNAQGSTLGAMSANTGADGTANVTLNSGTADATFQVTATAPEGAPVTFDITVTGDAVGFITVEMSYTGSETFNPFRAYLYHGLTCGDLTPFNLPTALQAASPVALLSDRPQFLNVPVGDSYAVAVEADVGGFAVGFGCTDAQSVAFGAETIVPVALDDIPISFNGVYDLDNHFDLTGVLPPSVATVVNLLDEMTDDQDVNGNAATQDFGQDPAAFLLDFVYRQFCCWEATGSNPDWNSCDAQSYKHDYGDLSAIYLQNFQTWNGAQPISFGLCGGLEMGTNEFLQNQVQNLIVSYVPDVVLRIADIAGDLARAINQMHILSVLTLTEVENGKYGPFTHELVSMETDIHDLQGNVHSYSFDLVSAGLTNLSYTGTTSATDDVLDIPQHSFELDFGKLIQYIYLNGILPLLGYTSTADMFADWIDCAQVGTWLANQIGIISATQYEQYCDAGLVAAGDAVDANIASVTSATTTFTIAGTCEAGDIDHQRVATTLTNGVWNGTWDENGQSASFTGTFTGVRR